MLEMEKFTEPRPPILSPRIDVRSKKKWDLDTNEDFAQSLKDKLSDLDEQYADQMEEEDVHEKKKKTGKVLTENQDAEVKASRQMSKILQGLGGFLPREILARIEQPKDKDGRKFNYEDEEAVYFPEKLVTPFYDNENEKELARDIFREGSFIDQASDLPGEGNTIPHNINLLKGYESNPFKKGDGKNYDVFQEDAAYSALHNKFMSPRSVLEKLDRNMYSFIQSVMYSIRETRVPAGMEDVDQYTNPYVSEDDNDLNWEDAPDPYIDNEIDTFDINANFHTILMSQQWVNWNPEQVFSFVNSTWETRTRAEDVLREIIGRSMDVTGYVDDAVKEFKELSEILKEVEAIEEEALAAVSEEEGAEEFDDFDLLKEEYTLVMKEAGFSDDQIKADLEAIEADIAKAETEEDQNLAALEAGLVASLKEAGYTDEEIAAELKNADDEVARKGFTEKANDAKRVDAIMEKAEAWWDAIGSKLNENMVLPFGILASMAPTMTTMMEWSNWAESAAEDVRSSMMADSFGFKDKMIGGYMEYVTKKYITAGDSFLSKEGEAGLKPTYKLFPDAKINGSSVSSISMKCEDGVYRDFNEIIELLNSGDSALEKVEGASVAYDTLFRMYLSVKGLSVDGKNNMGRQITRLEDGTLELAVFSDAEWMQAIPPVYDANGKIVQSISEEAVQGVLKLQFKSQEKIDKLEEDLRIILALLEPVVGTFGKREDGENFLMLTDNSGSSDSVDMITSESDEYKLQVDTLFNPEYFNTDSWKQVSKYIERSAMDVIKDKIFEKSQMNRMLRLANRRQKADYSQKKEEHEDSELDRIRREIKQIVKRKRAKNKDKKKVAVARKKARQAMMRNAVMRKKEEIARLNKSKSAQNKQKAESQQSKKA
jgi:hypothetical protein